MPVNRLGKQENSISIVSNLHFTISSLFSSFHDPFDFCASCCSSAVSNVAVWTVGAGSDTEYLRRPPFLARADAEKNLLATNAILSVMAGVKSSRACAHNFLC